MRKTITIQSKRISEEVWNTRNTLRELNAALAGDKITEQQALSEANLVLHSWLINYPQTDMQLRVHVARKR